MVLLCSSICLLVWHGLLSQKRKGDEKAILVYAFTRAVVIGVPFFILKVRGNGHRTDITNYKTMSI